MNIFNELFRKNGMTKKYHKNQNTLYDYLYSTVLLVNVTDMIYTTAHAEVY